MTTQHFLYYLENKINPRRPRLLPLLPPDPACSALFPPIITSRYPSCGSLTAPTR